MEDNKQKDEQIVNEKFNEIEEIAEKDFNIIDNNENNDEINTNNNINDEINTNENEYYENIAENHEINDVIIVGGGLSGLRAGLILKKANVKIKILEGRERVGGRSFNKPFPPPSLNININDADSFHPIAIDAGAQYVGVKHERLIQLIENYGLSTQKVYTKGKNIIFSEFNKYEYSGLIPSLKLPSLIDLRNIIKGIDKLAETINVEEPWKTKEGEALDGMTVQSWAEKKSFTKNAKQILTIAVRAVFGCELYEISMLYFLFYVKSNESISFLTESNNGAQDSYVSGGTHQISLHLANEIDFSNIELNTIVERISQEKGLIEVSSGDKKYYSKYLILALPPPLINNIKFSPLLPYARQQLNLRSTMTQMIKFHIFYENAFWRSKGYSGEINSDCQKETHIVTDFIENTQTSLSGKISPCLVGFICGKQAMKVSQNLSKDERRSIIKNQLYELIGDEEAKKELHYEETMWSTDQLQHGTLSIFSPGTLFHFGESLRTPFLNVHFAGTETAIRFSGYMEGALESGERAATEILNEIIKLQQ